MQTWRFFSHEVEAMLMQPAPRFTCRSAWDLRRDETLATEIQGRPRGSRAEPVA